MVKLNLGAGARRDPHWTHVDKVDRSGNGVLVHDLAKPLPFPDGCCEGAVIHHVLDLMTVDDVAMLLGEAHRVLKDDARLRISNADIVKASAAAMRRDLAWFPHQRGDLDTTLGFFITQGGARKSAWQPGSLHRALDDAGFKLSYDVECSVTYGPRWLVDLDGREHESFFVEALR